MSFYDYKESLKIAAQDYPFYALIMAAMRQADSDNAMRLKSMWPEVWADLEKRYHAPGGLLEGDRMSREDDS